MAVWTIPILDVMQRWDGWFVVEEVQDDDHGGRIRFEQRLGPFKTEEAAEDARSRAGRRR